MADRRKAAELGLVSAHGLSTLDNDIEAAITATADRMRATHALLANMELPVFMSH